MAVRTGVAVGGVFANGQGVGADLVAIVNELSVAVNALTAKLDADFANVTNADTDYAVTIGTMDTIAYSNGDTPS